MKTEELAVLALAALAVYFIVKGSGWKAPAYVTQTGDKNGVRTFSNGVMIDENGVYYDALGNAVWSPW